jgi:hypothetical protein
MPKANLLHLVLYEHEQNLLLSANVTSKASHSM